MTWQLVWLVASATVVAGLPSVVWASRSAAKAASSDPERWAMAMYVVTRSFALMAVAVISAIIAESGLVLGVAVTTILVQALDVAVAIGRRKPWEAVGAGGLALLVFGAVLVYAAFTP